MTGVDNVDRTVGMNTHTVRFAQSTVRFVSPFTQQDLDFFVPHDMSDEREPTEDELIDFMDWLIDHKLPDEQIDMARIEVTSDPMKKLSEDNFGPATGED